MFARTFSFGFLVELAVEVNMLDEKSVEASEIKEDMEDASVDIATEEEKSIVRKFSFKFLFLIKQNELEIQIFPRP